MLTEYIEHTVSQPEDTTNSYRVPIRIRCEGKSLESQPVQFGVCLPKGMFSGGIKGHLEVTEVGSATPVQLQPLVRHSDGSYQWILVDALFSGAARYSQETFLVLQEAEHDPPQEDRPSDAETFLVENIERPLRLSLREGQLFLEDQTSHARIFREKGLELDFIARNSRPYQPQWNSIHHETSGSVRNTYLLKGSIGRKRSPLNLQARLSFYSGTGLIKVEICLHNPRRARHAGGIWDLGDPGSELFEEFSVRIPHRFGRQSLKSWVINEHNKADLSECRHLHLYQDSSGGENWDSLAHVNRDGRVPCQFRGFRFDVDGKRIYDDRATPVCAVGLDQRALGIAVPEFWQQFPQSLEIDDREIKLGLFPAEFDDLHELQGGERKSFTFWMNTGSGPVALVFACKELQAVLSPIVMTPMREEYSRNGQMFDGTDIVSDNRPDLDRLLEIALEGPRSLFEKREAADEYGWRNYGELVADHEEAYYDGPLPLVSHYNNQFDPIYGFLLNYLRTGNRKLFELGDALARHVVDIDIYHTTQDKWGYNGGLFWHTDHYRHALTSTHRSYSRANVPESGHYGGGPCNEHNYTTGLFLHHCLTGRKESREAVLGLAEWVIQMDDGGRSMFRFVASGPTGLASATRDETFHGPGRGAGNSLNALIDAWKLSRDEKYLNYCQTLIRRCIHPNDEIEQYHLLNAEERWSYTVFLTSLLKYLNCKSRYDQLDANYQYAKASLIHYAAWMTRNERPYLDFQHRLEYPTETWAAQDLRKANVLRHCAAYLTEPLRSKCFVLGERIAKRAWNDLWSFETVACARPLSILMVEGLKEQANPAGVEAETEFPGHIIDFGATKRFVGQKTKVKQIIKRPWLLLKEFIPE